MILIPISCDQILVKKTSHVQVDLHFQAQFDQEYLFSVICRLAHPVG